MTSWGKTCKFYTGSPTLAAVPPILVQPPPPGPDKIEVQYLSQIRQPQWPINGLYRMHHRAAHYHFRRHADIKHIGKTEVIHCMQ